MSNVKIVTPKLNGILWYFDIRKDCPLVARLAAQSHLVETALKS